MKKETKSGKVASFFKHNAYYLIMGLCLIAIITMVSVAVVNLNNDVEPTIKPDAPVVKPDNPEEPVVVEPDMNFILPVKNATIVNGYSEKDSLYYNPILNEYSFHGGIDFATEGKQEVLAALDGEVISAKKHKMYGYVVEIKHAKNIVTTYRSLEDLKVKEGDVVKKGDIIGFTSTSDISESYLKEHVHFEIKENGKQVNPNKHLVFEEK